MPLGKDEVDRISGLREKGRQMPSGDKRLLALRVLAGTAAALLWLVAASGCAMSEYADYHSSRIRGAMEYLPVDPVGQSLGYDRLMINCRYRPPLQEFVTVNGLPDVIFEYSQGPRDGIRLYYLEKNIVYDFMEEDWKPESIHLVDKRALSSLEKAEIKERMHRLPY